MSNALMIPDLEPQLVKAREGLANSEALASTFAPHFAAFREQGGAAMLVQPDQPKKAGEIRKALKAIRVAADKDRKALKDDFLRTGRAIDGYHAILEHALVPIETAMREIEEAEERREAARRLALRDARVAELTPYMDPQHMLAVLGDLPEDAYQAQLAGAKAVKAAAEKAAAEAAEAARVAAEAAEAARVKKEADDKAERDRLQREAEEAKEAARLAKVESDRIAAEAAEAARVAKAEADRIAEEARIEAAKIKAEQDRKDAEAAEALRKEREAAAERERVAKAEADRLAAEAVERERLAKAEQDRKDEAARAEIARLKKEADDREAAEREAAAERERVAKRAAAAPDREKLHALSEMVRDLPMPELATAPAQGLLAKIAAEVQALAERIKNAADKV